MSATNAPPRARPHTGGGRPGPGPRDWLALAVVLFATFMDMVDVTIVGVALPAIQRDLGAGYASGQWFVAAYALAFALVLVTGGRLGDVAGRKRIFTIGVAGFTAASALCGAATSPAMMIGARLAQGAFAALMVPQVLSVIQTTFPPPRRAAAFALYGMSLSLAQVSGPLLGGLLSTYDLGGLGWRAIFAINVPLGLLALAGSVLLLRESRAEHPVRLDLAGVALVSLASALVMYPLTRGRELGWPLWTFLALAAAVPVLLLFAAHQRRRDLVGRSPLVPPRLFRLRSFAAGSVLLLVVMSGIASFFLVLVWHAQFALGWTPLRTALATLGWPLGIGLTAQVALRAPAAARRRLVGAGCLVMALGMAGLSVVVGRAAGGLAGWQVFGCLVVAGAGMGLMIAIVIDVVLGEVPPADAGAGSGVANALMQLGGALGIALIGVLFFGFLGRDAGAQANAAVPRVRADLVAAGVSAPEADRLVAGFVACQRDRAQATDPTATPASCRFALPAERRAGVPAEPPAGVRADHPRAAPAGGDPRVAEVLAAAAQRTGAAASAGATGKSLGYNVLAFLVGALLSPLLPRAPGGQPPAERADSATSRAQR